jgi:hypothetical protein
MAFQMVHAAELANASAVAGDVRFNPFSPICGSARKGLQ